MKSPKPQDTVKNPLLLLEMFEAIEDPRIERHRRYPLKNILCFTFVAILSDQQSWYQIVDFCEINLDWFSELIDVSAGVPSHDTFRRVLSLLRPEILAEILTKWAENLRNTSDSNSNVVAIDGKALRGVPWKLSEEELYTLNAFEPGTGLCLGQVEVDSKSNEITAMPKLLDALNLKGTVVTTDALLTQKSIAQHIRNKEAHYLLALKGNHQMFFEETKLYFDIDHTGEFCWRTLEKNRGYVEERTCMVSGDTQGWQTLEEWPELKRVLRISLKRTREGNISIENRYYITSLEAGALTYLEAVRSHWSVENQLHRTLDIIFLEDAAQEHNRTAAAN